MRIDGDVEEFILSNFIRFLKKGNIANNSSFQETLSAFDKVLLSKQESCGFA